MATLYSTCTLLQHHSVCVTEHLYNLYDKLTPTYSCNKQLCHCYALFYLGTQNKHGIYTKGFVVFCFVLLQLCFQLITKSCGLSIYRADSRFVPSQWETALPCNDVSHWMGANLESALILHTSGLLRWDHRNPDLSAEYVGNLVTYYICKTKLNQQVNSL